MFVSYLDNWRYEDEQRFTKTGSPDHESPRELERQSETQSMLAPQSEANVSTQMQSQKISPINRTGHPTEIMGNCLNPN